MVLFVLFFSYKYYYKHRSKRALSDVCNALDASTVCTVVNIGDAICKPLEGIDTAATAIAQEASKAIDTVFFKCQCRSLWEGDVPQPLPPPTPNLNLKSY